MKTQMKEIPILFMLLIICRSILWAQADSSNMVKYSPDFKFEEGIYLNFEQVKNNDPLPKSRIISTVNYNDPDFFDKLLEHESIFYYDNIGNKKELKTRQIWGYSRNGFVYIKMPDGFFRITLIGTVCHFVATETTYISTYNSPYTYNSYSDPYGMHSTTQPTTEMRQYILDFNTGRVMDYTEEALDVIFMEDSKIHDEYSSLNKKKRKQMKFYYMRKYNEANPLFFPKN